MSFSPEFLDELRGRVRLSDVVGRKVRLVRKGREHSGLCPFHNEKTPSFTVNDDKAFYHCFGCGAHGDAIRFLTDSEGLNFRDAVERLAQEAGLAIPDERPEDAERARHRATLHDVNEAAAKWYESQLWTAIGRDALAYLRKRGLTDETIRAFRLGYAPGGGKTALKDGLVARDIEVALLEEAGLLVTPDGERDSFDRFRNRVMFPILDNRGRVVAFGGRALDDAPAKYLNSPETPLFHKGRMLYNLVGARGPARDRNRVIVVEGYMDVISLSQAGFPEAVAPLGTALTEDQIGELWKVVPEPVLCFDGDNAGRRAAARAVERALPLLKPGHSLRFTMLPQGEDPDSFVQTQGTDAFGTLLNEAGGLADLLWSGLIDAHPADTPERRAGFEATVRETLQRISDGKVRHFYESEFRDRMFTLFRPQSTRAGEYGQKRGAGQRTDFNGRSPAGFSRRGAKTIRDQRLDPISGRLSAARLKTTALSRDDAGAQNAAVRSRGREGFLILSVINHPALIDPHGEELLTIEFRNGDLDKLRSEIIRIAASVPDLDMIRLRSHLKDQGYGRVLASLDKALEPVWLLKPNAALVDVETGWRHVLGLHRQVTVLQHERERLEAELEQELSDDAYDRLKGVLREIEEAEGREANLTGFGIASGRNITG